MNYVRIIYKFKYICTRFLTKRLKLLDSLAKNNQTKQYNVDIIIDDVNEPTHTPA